MVTHQHAFAQAEYKIPCYIPAHFVHRSNRSVKISNITPLLWAQKAHDEALLLRNEMNVQEGVPT